MDKSQQKKAAEVEEFLKNAARNDHEANDRLVRGSDPVVVEGSVVSR